MKERIKIKNALSVVMKMRSANGVFKVWCHAAINKMCIVLCILSLFLVSVPHASAQNGKSIENALLDKQNQRAALLLVTENEKIVGEIEKVVKDYEKVAPYLSMAVKLLFKTEEEPSYAEMKAEWQGYTDKKITKERINRLSKKLLGLQDLVKEIDTIYKEQEEGKFPNITYRKYATLKIDAWQNVVDSVVQELPAFTKLNTSDKSQDEPVAPILPMLGGVANLHKNALDQLITLRKSFDYSLVAKTKSDRTEMMKKHNRTLESHIAAAAEERANKVRMTTEPERMGFFMDLDGKDINGNPKFKETPSYYYTYTIWDQDPITNDDVVIYQNKTTLPARSEGGGRKTAENWFQTRKNNVRNKFKQDARRKYLIRENITLFIKYVRDDMTNAKFINMFERFGPVREWLRYRNGGYIKMNYSGGMNAMAYWNSKRGQERATGVVRNEVETKELLRSNKAPGKPWVFEFTDDAVLRGKFNDLTKKKSFRGKK